MGLVSTWLRGIGLAYAIPSFRSRHITTPQKLSLLTLADYDALGVKEVGDRKKLFYLVQRIRMAVKEGEMAGKGGEGDNGGGSCDGNDTGNDKSEDTAKDTAKDASNNCDDNNDDESSSSADLPPAVSCHDMDSVDLIADDTENDLVNVAENDPLPTTATATSTALFMSSALAIAIFPARTLSFICDLSIASKISLFSVISIPPITIGDILCSVSFENFHFSMIFLAHS